MNIAYLLTGSNLNNPIHQITEVKRRITSCGNIIKSSAIYQTDAWGMVNQPSFFNQALMLETPYSARELMEKLLQIEEEMGRIRTNKFAPRVIDIDILFFNNCIIKTASLSIPHPLLPQRKFALIPINEIASAYLHPQLNKTVSELLDNCNDSLRVEKMDK